MRILHIDPDDMANPVSGGGPVRTFEICRRLATRHEITVLTPTFPGSEPELVREGIRYLRLGRRIGDHGSSHHFTFMFALPGAVRRFDYDLLVEDFMPPMSATLDPLFAKAPVVASVQWFFASTLSQQYKLPFWIGERYGVKLYNDFIVLTNSMKQRIEALNRRANCAIVPNGIDDSLFDIPASPGRNIIYLGRVDFEQKGVDLLLAAYAKIPETKRLPLVLAGHCLNPNTVRARIEQFGLANSVALFGRYDNRERARLIGEARFVCVPSRDETFGMTIAEACAGGKPVIYFDRAPMNEVAGAGCVAVPSFRTDAYAAAMQSLIEESDSALLKRGEQCRSGAQRFRWDHAAARQEAFYVAAAERRRRARR